MPRSHHVSPTTLVKMTAAAAANLSRRKIMATYPEAPERLVNAIVRARLSAEEWQELIGTELRSLAAEVTQQIRQDLRSDKVGPNHKALLLGILLDKAIASENRSAVRSANISMQINNYGDLSREEIIARLQGHRLPSETKPAQPVLAEKAGDG